jgi:hypothetical protein
VGILQPVSGADDRLGSNSAVSRFALAGKFHATNIFGIARERPAIRKV